MGRPVLNSFTNRQPPLLALNHAAIAAINRCRVSGTIIMLFGNGKGGCGKSTLVMNTATSFGWHKKRVLIIDADTEQLTTAHWPRTGRPSNLTIKAWATADILERLAGEVAHYDVVLIDLPGRDDRAIVPVMEIADILISPTKPCHQDMKELGRFINTAKARNLPHLTIFNEATREMTNEIVQLRKLFSQFEPFSPVAIQQLATYRRIYAYGAGVRDISGEDPAKANFERVFEHLEIAVRNAHAQRVSSLR